MSYCRLATCVGLIRNVEQGVLDTVGSHDATSCRGAGRVAPIPLSMVRMIVVPLLILVGSTNEAYTFEPPSEAATQVTVAPAESLTGIGVVRKLFASIRVTKFVAVLATNTAEPSGRTAKALGAVPEPMLTGACRVTGFPPVMSNDETVALA